MRTHISLAFLLVTSAALFGCSGSRLSDADLTRLCELSVRCSGGAITQASCEMATRESRDDAAAAGCANYFGAAGRCAIRVGSCGVDSDCADMNARLEACLTPRGDAGPGNDVGVVLPDVGVVTESMIRLGENGAIEIFHDGRWGPICDDGFGMEEANVACRHLGFSGAESFSTITGASSDFWLDNVTCVGAEAWLDQCEHLPWGEHNCSASETQAVVCF